MKLILTEPEGGGVGHAQAGAGHFDEFEQFRIGTMAQGTAPKCLRTLKTLSKPKKETNKFILRGWMRCGECGRMITAELQKNHVYYRCTKRLTNCKQKYVREEELAAQIKSFIQKVSLCDDWTKKILEQLEKDNNSSVQSSLPQQQNLEVRIKEVDTKISKLIDVYLAESLTLEEYQAKKEAFINEKRKLQDDLRDFAAGANNWFEPAREFVTSLNSAHSAMEEGHLESQKEFLEKIGSNFILKERRLNFSTEASFRPLFEAAPYPCWRRGRDSNPGTLTGYVFSKHARSTTTRPLPRIRSIDIYKIDFSKKSQRRVEDSNLRSSYDDNGFRDRRIQPALPTLQTNRSSLENSTVGQRFELWVDLRPQRFSRPPLSTTQPPHQRIRTRKAA